MEVLEKLIEVLGKLLEVCIDTVKSLLKCKSEIFENCN
jgi:hypothetical protein